MPGSAIPIGSYTPGPFSSGQVIEVTIPANSVLTPGDSVNILECADPGGLPANDPTNIAQCDGNTIQGDTILVNSDGSIDYKNYTVYALPDSISLGEPANNTPVCNLSNECVLYIGQNQNDFTQPHFFSQPFYMATDAGDLGTNPGDGTSPYPGSFSTTATVSGLDSEAQLNWTTPTPGYGSITGYSISSTPNCLPGCTIPNPGTSTSATVTGLTPGTTYTFTVTATNSASLSTPSTSNAVTAATSPTAPSGLSASALSTNAIEVTWNSESASQAGGVAVASYTFACTSPGCPGAQSTTPSGGPTTSAFFGGLSPATAYSFTVSATNANSLTGPSSSTGATTPSAAGAPGTFAVTASATGTNSGANLSWTAPSPGSGATSITGYSIFSDPNCLPGCTIPNPGTSTTATVAGLTAGKAYVFTVTATNNNSLSTSETSNSVSAATTPAAPTVLTPVLFGAQALQIAWDNETPAQAGGSPVTSYTVTCSGSTAASCLASQQVSPGAGGTTVVASFTGLGTNKTVTFTVSATTANGLTSSATTVSGHTPTTAPTTGNPGYTSVSAAANGNDSAGVTWPKPPVGIGGSTTLSYSLSTTPNCLPGCTIPTISPTTAANLSETITGLTAGTTYTVTVTVTNSKSLSTPSTSNSATAATSPAAPTGFGATPQSTTAIQLTWNNETTIQAGGAAVSNYTVTCTGTGCPAAQSVAPWGGAITSYTFSSLSPATSYSFTVSATNASSLTGPTSAASASTPSANSPPGSFTVTASTTGLDSAANLSWTTPSAGTGSITDYTVTCNGTNCPAMPNPGTSTSAIVTGLTAGDGYTFTVTATNTAALSTQENSNIVTAATTPIAPTGFTATAQSSTSIQVTWNNESATDAGGVAVSNYTVTCTGPGCPSAQSVAPTGGSTTSYTFTGLTPSTSYSFTVDATNDNGLTGPTSSASASTQASNGPPGPFTVTASVSGLNDSAQLSWTTPTPGTGATSITGYSISSTPNCLPGCTIPNPGTSTSATVTGLTAGTSYTFTVTATNNNSLSTQETSNMVTAATTPIAPTGFTATAQSTTSIQVTWNNESATDAGGVAVSNYTVTCTGPGCPSAQSVSPSVGSTTSYTFTGLTTDTNYSFTVDATNDNALTGPTSSASAYTQANPGSFTVTANTSGLNDEADLSWTTPSAGNPSETITGYSISSSPDCTPGCTIPNAGTSTTANVTGLTAGTSYTFTVTATNSDNLTSQSTSNMVTAATTPIAPTGFTATAQSTTSVQVTWNNESTTDAGGVAVSNYTVTCAGPGCPVQQSVSPSGGSTTSFTFTGLSPGTSYSFTVNATNDNDLAGPTSSASATTPSGGFSVTASTTGLVDSAQLSWTTATGGGTLTGFSISSSPNCLPGCTIPNPGTSTSATVTGLHAGTTYTFTVTASYSSGPQAMATSNSVTAATNPVAPPGFKVQSRTSSAITVKWTDNTATTASDGGVVVSYYTLTCAGPGCPAPQTVAPSGAATSVTVSGLTASDDYEFSVTATNANLLTGPASYTGSFTVTASASGVVDGANLSWTAPSGLRTVNGYTITCTGTACPTMPDPGTSTSAAITGLTSGDKYSFKVTATMNVGPTEVATSNTITAAQDPNAPSGLTATAISPTAIFMQWTNETSLATGDGGVPLSSWTVTCSGTGCPFSSMTVPAGPGTNQIFGPYNGFTAHTPYMFTVSATNQNNLSGPALSASATTP